jgi:hypothetical protein
MRECGEAAQQGHSLVGTAPRFGSWKNPEMNWSHPLVLVVASAITATVITLVIDVFLKPMLQPRIEARVEDWKRRNRFLHSVNEQLLRRWGYQDGDRWVGSIDGDERFIEELTEFRLQRHHLTKRERVAAKALVRAFNDTFSTHQLYAYRDTVQRFGCEYLTTPRWRWVARQRTYRQLTFRRHELDEAEAAVAAAKAGADPLVARVQAVLSPPPRTDS